MPEKPRGTFPWPDDNDPVMVSLDALSSYIVRRRARAAALKLLAIAGLIAAALLLR